MGVNGKVTRSKEAKSEHPKAEKSRQGRFALKLDADFSPASLPLLVLDILETYQPAWFGPLELRETVWRITPGVVQSSISRAVQRLADESAIHSRDGWGTYYKNGRAFNYRIREVRFKEEE